jgi:hypothetical protein
MATGQTTQFVLSPALQQSWIQQCGGCGPLGGISPVRIGDDWAEVPLFDGDPEHILQQFAFQNLQTGNVLANPAGEATTVNLNSPTLAENVCAPLTVPTFRTAYSQAPSTLTPIDDGFEIADANDSYLERCGTHLHQFLGSDLPYNCAPPTCGPVGNAHLVVMENETGIGWIDGMFLPSRQRFSIYVPVNVGSVGADLAVRHLYLSAGLGIWSTPIPRPPKPRPKNG